VSARSTTTACDLRAVEQGWSGRPGSVYYGLIVANPCSWMAANIVLTVTPLDRAGKQIPVTNVGVFELGVMMPGQRAGVGGVLGFGHQAAASPARLAVAFTHTDWRPAPRSGYPTTAAVTNIKIGMADADGDADVTFNVTTHPTNGGLCKPKIYVILRDHTGTILTGGPLLRALTPSPATNTITLWLPSRVDAARTEVYVLQGYFSLFGQAGLSGCPRR
jgi:hypothetical protein